MSGSASFSTASRIHGIGVSEILQIGARARALAAEGHSIISLNIGEPDFAAPDNVRAAAIEAIQHGDNGYTPLDGTLELKQAIRAKFLRENNLQFELEQISVSSGAKQVVFNAFMATIEAGDEVIIPAPYWTSYKDIILVCGAKPVFVPCEMENGFKLTPDKLKQAITRRTRWLLLNSPGNPSGAAYSRKEYSALVSVLSQHPAVWVLADDIYEHILYDDFQFSTPAQIDPEIGARTLTVNGVSKAYAMTGWRIGYAAGPEKLIKSMAVIQSQSTSCPSSVSQAAATEALNGPQGFLNDRCDSFRKRRDLVVAGLNATEDIVCPKPEGAFYVFASCEGLINKKTPTGEQIFTDSDFCKYLLEHAGVALVPGSVFGLSPYFRISYAASEDVLLESIRRISDFMQRLQD